MAATGLFIVTNPKKVVASVLRFINQKVRKTLYIHLLSNGSSQPQKIVTEDWKERLKSQLPNVCGAIMNLYSNVSATCPELDTCILLEPIKNSGLRSITTKKAVDIVIFDSGFSCDDLDLFVKSYVANASKQCTAILAPQDDSLESVDGNEIIQSKGGNHGGPRVHNNIYENVVLGGTFDRLHNGHKILLSEASLRCSKKLTIGVTDANMVKSKILNELIEPCSARIQSVKTFVNEMDSSISYDIVPIDDPFGPTKSDENLQLIVVSGETYKGGLKVNELRETKGLLPLEIHEIPILQNESKQHSEEEEKMSSSALRMRLLGKTLKTPELQPRVPLVTNGGKVPYIVGLIGGIASGKSSVAKRLAKLGAGVVNCDVLGHRVYQKGQPCYDDLLNTYGPEIVDNDGEINRIALGKIVFSDEDKMMQLNNLVWPRIANLVKESVVSFAEQGKMVVFIEAAVLLKAHWDDYCNEVWACIIPQNEAIRRLKERSGLEQNECEKRVASQTPNAVAVAAAHIVLSTLWHEDFTQKQVEIAWDEIQSRVDRWMTHQMNSNL